MKPYRALFIKCPTGGGKTTFIVNHLRDLKTLYRVVVVTYRIELAKFYARQLPNFSCYLKRSAWYVMNAARLIILS